MNELETHLVASLVSEEKVIKDQHYRGGNVDAEPINQSSLLEKPRERCGADTRLDHVAFGSQGPHDQPEHSATRDLDKQRSVQTRHDEGEGGGTQTKSGGQTLPTTMPTVDSDDFYDPISDRFWNGIWIASAVHNVSGITPYIHFKLNLRTVDRSIS